MRRLLAWAAGAAGGLAAYRALAGRRRGPEAVPDGRAEELKAKLAAVREAPAAPAGDETVMVAPETLAPETLDPEARRKQVHDQGRAALDEMRGD